MTGGEVKLQFLEISDRSFLPFHAMSANEGGGAAADAGEPAPVPVMLSSKDITDRKLATRAIEYAREARPGRTLVARPKDDLHYRAVQDAIATEATPLSGKPPGGCFSVIVVAEASIAVERELTPPSIVAG